MKHTLAIDGGLPVRMSPWPTYDKGDAEFDRDDETAALRVLRSRRLFRYDDRAHDETEAGQLEAELCRTLDVTHALACSSGTTAISLALLGAQLRAGARVGCPAFTFAATPSAIILAGARPVLIEVDEDLHMDLDDLAAKIDGLDALVVVHMRGFSSDVEAICALARERGVPVIEDAVPILGVRLRGKALGTFGLAGAFSFQSDKTINTGEGGCLVTNDAQLCARAAVYSGAFERRLRHHVTLDSARFDERELPLFSFRMDELRAALARVQLAHLPARVVAHQRIHTYVAERIEELGCLAVRRPVAADAYLGEALVFRITEGSDGRVGPWFARALRAEGVDARCFGDPADMNVRSFWNWHFMFPAQGESAIKTQAPASASYLERAIDVPLSRALTPDDCDDVVAAIRKVASAVGWASRPTPHRGPRSSANV